MGAADLVEATRCPDTRRVVDAPANAPFPMGDGRRMSGTAFLEGVTGDPVTVAVDAFVRTDARFLIESGSMILGGFTGISTDADAAFGVVSVLGTLVGSNGWRLLRGIGVRG